MLLRTQSFVQPIKRDVKIYNICNGLYISSGQAVWNLENLQSNGITHIVNAAPQVESCHFQDSIIYHTIPVLDSSYETIDKHFKTVNKFIKNAIHHGGSVLVHCHEGISRAPTICAGYLIEHNNFKNDKALDYIKKIKSNINPNEGFKSQLRRFYIDCSSNNCSRSTL